MKFSATDKPFLLKKYTYNYSSVSGSGVTRFTRAVFNYDIPAGYVPVAVTRVATGVNDLVVDYISTNKNTSEETAHLLAVRNVSSNATASNTATVVVLFVRDDFVSEEYVYT